MEIKKRITDQEEIKRILLDLDALGKEAYPAYITFYCKKDNIIYEGLKINWIRVDEEGDQVIRIVVHTTGPEGMQEYCWVEDEEKAFPNQKIITWMGP